MTLNDLETPMSAISNITLREQERIVHVVRRYGATYFWSWLSGILLVSTGFFFLFWFLQHDWWGLTIFGILLAIGLGTLFKTYFFWKKNVCVVTTHRIIDVTYHGFFHHVLSDVSYEHVEDIAGSIKGILGSLFHFGDVVIQTANGSVEIILARVKHPIGLQQQINDLRTQYLSKYAHVFSGDVAEAIIEKLYELNLPELLLVEEALEKRMKKIQKTTIPRID